MSLCRDDAPGVYFGKSKPMAYFHYSLCGLGCVIHRYSQETFIEAHLKIEPICRSAKDKKAEDIVIMDMKGRSSLCDYFVVMSAPSAVRVKAIADSIEQTMEEEGFYAAHREGYKEALWVLVDYGDVLVHVFHEDTRKFYQLEHLWGDAPKHVF